MGVAPAPPLGVAGVAGVAAPPPLGVAGVAGVAAAPELGVPAVDVCTVCTVCAVQLKFGAPPPPELLEVLWAHKTTSLLVVSMYQVELALPPPPPEAPAPPLPNSGMNCAWLLVVAAGV